MTLADLGDIGSAVKGYSDEYNLAGKFLKFSGDTGDYKCGDEPVDPGTVFAVDVLGFSRGWVCWKNKKPIDRDMVPMFPHKPMTAQGDLTDHGPYAKRPDGTDAEGWTEIVEGSWTDMATGESYKFGLSSKSGRKALVGLFKEFAQKIRMHVDDAGRPMIPLVEIDATSFPIAGGGKKFAPVFKMTGEWITREEYDSMSPSGEEGAGDDVEEVEEIPLEPAPKAAAKAPVKSAAPAGRSGNYKSIARK